MSVPWYVELLLSTAEGPSYQTEGMYLVYARVSPFILPSVVSMRFLAIFSKYLTVIDLYVNHFSSFKPYPQIVFVVESLF